MSRGWKIALGVAGIVVAAGAGMGAWKSQQGKSTEVATFKVKRDDVISKVTANGKIQAERKVDLSALVMGQIVNLAVKEGDAVKAGDLLLQIDPNRAAADEAGSAAALRSAEADLASLRSSFEQAERDFARAAKNFEARILSEAEFQHSRSTLDSAQGAFRSAQNRVEQFRAGLSATRDTLKKTTVSAPIDGVVTALRVKAGEVTVLGTMNNPGTQLMTISDMTSVLAVLMVDETDMPAVAVGQKASLTLDSYPERAFDGEVIEAGHSPIARDDVDLMGLTTTSDAINFKVKVKLFSPPPGIRPGFSVTADIVTGTRPGALVVPLAAVVIRDDPEGERTPTGKLRTESGVYLFDGDKARFVTIETGLTGELMVEVVKGLDEGQEIVSGPFKALREIKDGDKLKREPEDRKKKSSGAPDENK